MRVSGGTAERIPRRLHVVSIEPDVGLDPRNREIMTRTRVKSPMLNRPSPPDAPGSIQRKLGNKMLREAPAAQGPRPFSFAPERRLTVLRGRQWKPDRTVPVLCGDSSKAVNRLTDRAVQERSLLSKLLGVKQKLERTNEGAPPPKLACGMLQR